MKQLPNENQSPRVTLSLSFFDLERHAFFLFFIFFSSRCLKGDQTYKSSFLFKSVRLTQIQVGFQFLFFSANLGCSIPASFSNLCSCSYTPLCNHFIDYLVIKNMGHTPRVCVCVSLKFIGFSAAVILAL